MCVGAYVWVLACVWVRVWFMCACVCVGVRVLARVSACVGAGVWVRLC